MSGVKASLKAAADCIAKGDYKEALAHCKAALKADKSNYDTYILIGKAAFHLNEHQQSDLAYRKAIELDAEALPAWKGLAELAAATGNTHGTIEAYQQLLEHAPGEEVKRREWQGVLAEALSRVGRYEDAVQQYTAILQGLTDAPARLSLCCRLADIQIKLDEARAAAEMQARVDALAAAPPAGPDATSPTTSPRPKPGRIVSQRTVSNLQLEVLAAHALVDQQAAAGPLAGSSPRNKVGSPVRASVTSPVTSPRGPAPAAPQAPALRPDGRPCTWSTLVEVCNNTAPTPQYMCYHEELLKRCLLRIFAAPPRSVERQQHRLAALRECHAMIFNGRAGCTTPLPYEAAVWLLEEEEEIKGGHVSVGGQVVGGTSMAHVGAEGRIGCGQTAVVFALENFARRMVHQFPTDPTAQVCLGLMMRRRLAGTHPASLTQRRAIERLLRRAMAGDSHADCASGWKGLAELQYENMDYQAAYDTAVRGLTWLQSRRERGHERLGQCALALRLVVAKALRRMGRLDEAEVHFKVLAGWVSEGETAFGDLSGSSPMSINQQALRGIAQIQLERGDRCAAKAQYERILGKAALGHGPGEHWAHSDYGWLLYQDGDLQSARQQLEQAIVVAETPGAHITDVQMSQHRYRLGEVYWALKGRYRTDKQFAYKQFLEAAKIESHEQAAALAALGRYFEQVERRSDQAARVYKKALALDPTLATAGVSVVGVSPGIPIAQPGGAGQLGGARVGGAGDSAAGGPSTPPLPRSGSRAAEYHHQQQPRVGLTGHGTLED